MRFDERLGNGESESGTSVVVASGEEPEDLLSPVAAHTWAVVGDGDLDGRRISALRADRDRGVLWAVCAVRLSARKKLVSAWGIFSVG
jgi:hypothetical protein